MPIVDKINRFLNVWVDVFKQFGRGRIWLILFIYFLFNWVILYAHYDFLSPLFYGAVTTWTDIADALTGAGNAEAFTHFPGHLYFLGSYFGWAKLLIGIIVEGLLLGAVARIFARHFFGEEAIVRKRSFFMDWLNLTVVWAVINGLTLAAGIFLPEWLAPGLGSPRRYFAFVAAVMPSVFGIILALFYYGIPYVAVRGENALMAIGRSLRMFGRNPLSSLFFAAFTILLPAVFFVISNYTTTIVEKLNPSMVYWLLVAELVAIMIANFFWMGTATRFLAEDSDR